MRIYSYSLQTFGSRRVSIGKQGEHMATRIDIDITPWIALYPDALIALYIKPPAGEGYLAAIESDGKSVRWTVLGSDTAYAGIGHAEILMKNAEGMLIKSVTAETYCMESISCDEPVDPPEAIRPWVDQILDAIAGAGAGGGSGVGIAKIEQTAISFEDGGVNVWTATLTDGRTYSLEVRNGQKGSSGTDYVLTEADKQEIAGMVEVTGGGGVDIDDTTPSTTTTYSSEKIEQELNTLNQANAAQNTEIAKKASDADLAKVAKSGSYDDLTGKPTIPSAYTLPTASASVLGGVKVGNGLAIDENGVLSLNVSNASGVSF